MFWFHADELVNSKNPNKDVFFKLLKNLHQKQLLNDVKCEGAQRELRHTS